MNRAATGVCLVLGGLVCLGGGIGLGVVFHAKDIIPQEDNVTYLDEQARLVLAQQHQAEPPPLPQPPVNKQTPPQPDVKPEVKAPPPAPKPAPPELPPVFELPPPAPPVLGVNNKEINAAIEQGVKWLKTHQNLNGTWGIGAVHAVGYTALPG